MSTAPRPAPSARPAASSDGEQRLRLGSFAWFAGIHLACLAALWTGVSWAAAAVCVGYYALRMFALTAGYHRHFAHRSYSTTRGFRFLLGALGTLAVQRGPIWWAATHRAHHRSSDQPSDVHSPRRGFWWSHVGWIFSARHSATDVERVRDLVRFPELRWLDRFHYVPPLLAGVALFALGAGLDLAHPERGVQMLVWGFAVSTVLLYHGTWSVNSVVHRFGRRRFETDDDSRNNVWVALVTGGEGWHNNHHRFPASERQGFYWWELDLTHLVLAGLARVGLVWDLRRPPPTLLAQGRARRRAG